MKRLKELQAEFSRHLQSQPNNINQQVVDNHIANVKRLQIYKNNYFFLLNDRLRSTYSSVESLVGQAYFKKLAKLYIEQYPATQSDINAFGDQFSTFLEKIKTEHQLDYLADIAQFEWLQTKVYEEDDHNNHIDVFNKLSQIDSEQHAKIVFLLAPATRLFHSKHAIDEIFSASLSPDNTTAITNTLKNRYWLIFRHDQSVKFRDINLLEYHFLQAIINQKNMQEIMELDEQIAVQFSDIFVKFVQLGHIIDCYIGE